MYLDDNEWCNGDEKDKSKDDGCKWEWRQVIILLMGDNEVGVDEDLNMSFGKGSLGWWCRLYWVLYKLKDINWFVITLNKW